MAGWLAVTAVVALGAGCTGERPTLAAEESPKDAVVPATTAPSTTVTPEPDRSTIDISLAVTANVPRIDVFESKESAEPAWSFDNPIDSGGPLVFLAVERHLDGWLHVLLPIRPNGTTGWIREENVTLAEHQFRVEVHLQEFRLDVFEAGEVVFTATVGVARDNAPTPGGTYYITELLEPPGDNSPYGSYAYGLSGFSDVFETFAGGPGQLGIHGTDDPASIGTQVSSGCVRLTNEDIERLVALLPLGTPVAIVA